MEFSPLWYIHKLPTYVKVKYSGSMKYVAVGHKSWSLKEIAEMLHNDIFWIPKKYEKKNSSLIHSSQVDISRTLKLLQLYSASPNDLILNYYSERFTHQLDQQHPNGDQTSVYPFGSITVRAIGK